MIPRAITPKMVDLLTKFPILSLTGARQSGKTTLLREQFSIIVMSILSKPTLQIWLETDIRSFLSLYDNNVIFDEAQRVPGLFLRIAGYGRRTPSGTPDSSS